MSKLLFDINGDLYRATEYQVVSEEDLDRELSDAQAEIDRVNEAKDFSNRLQTATSVDTTEPEYNTPEVEQPAPTPEATAPVPEQPAVPTQPEQPAFDPATAPAPVAPIVLS